MGKTDGRDARKGSCTHQVLYQPLAKSRCGQESVTLLFCDNCLEIESFSRIYFYKHQLQAFWSEIVTVPKNQILPVASTYIS